MNSEMIKLKRKVSKIKKKNRDPNDGEGDLDKKT